MGCLNERRSLDVASANAMLAVDTPFFYFFEKTGYSFSQKEMQGSRFIHPRPKLYSVLLCGYDTP
jgi:hypothetical protein